MQIERKCNLPPPVSLSSLSVHLSTIKPVNFSSSDLGRARSYDLLPGRAGIFVDHFSSSLVTSVSARRFTRARFSPGLSAAILSTLNESWRASKAAAAAPGVHGNVVCMHVCVCVYVCVSATATVTGDLPLSFSRPLFLRLVFSGG